MPKMTKLSSEDNGFCIWTAADLLEYEETKWGGLELSRKEEERGGNTGLPGILKAWRALIATYWVVLRSGFRRQEILEDRVGINPAISKSAQVG